MVTSEQVRQARNSTLDSDLVMAMDMYERTDPHAGNKAEVNARSHVGMHSMPTRIVCFVAGPLQSDSVSSCQSATCSRLF